MARYWAGLNGIEERMVLFIYKALLHGSAKALTLQLVDGRNYRFVLLECHVNAHQCEFHDQDDSRMQSWMNFLNV